MDIENNMSKPVGESCACEDIVYSDPDESEAIANAYTSSLSHLLAHLERIDLLLQVYVSQARKLYLNDNEFRGLVISEAEIEQLINSPCGLPVWANNSNLPSSMLQALDKLSEQIRLRSLRSVEGDSELRLNNLAYMFGLDQFEIDVLLVAIAPEVDSRYERIYAYLQDNVTKQRPGIDLVLNLLCPSFECKVKARKYFNNKESSLIKHQLAYLLDNPLNPSHDFLSKQLKVDDRVVDYLLGSDEIALALQDYVSLINPKKTFDNLVLEPGLKTSLLSAIKSSVFKEAGLVLYFQGPYGVGKKSIAESVCHERNMKLLEVDFEKMDFEDVISFKKNINLIIREARLHNATILWAGFDLLLAQNNQIITKLFFEAHVGRNDLVMISGSAAWEPNNKLPYLRFLRCELSHLSFAGRVQMWKQLLKGKGHCVKNEDINALANNFRFTAGQIQDAVRTAFNQALWKESIGYYVTLSDLNAACRLQSNQKLSTLAQKIIPCYSWKDLVLPEDILNHLREVYNSAINRSKVFSEWGYSKKISLGKGINVLLSGPSGTGKTMAVEIIAGEMGLDLYKIDISRVVSKYIGETEKNLSRIFTEAESSNCILFFDEADAIFGKRSEVKSSHDRHANIETGYLLQKIEDYEGVVFLATNLRNNIDSAFLRRMYAIIEFPLPDESRRQKIWENTFPEQLPLNEEIDYKLLANKFKITGGNIRNIGLYAAHLCAEESEKLNMYHIMYAIKREFQKINKPCTEVEFGRYYELIK